MFFGIEPGTAIPIAIILLLIIGFGAKGAFKGGDGKGSGRSNGSSGSSSTDSDS